MMALRKLIPPMRPGRGSYTISIAALALGALVPACAADDSDVYELVEWQTERTERGEQIQLPGPVFEPPGTPAPDPGDSWLNYQNKEAMRTLIYGADESIERNAAFDADARAMVMHDPDGHLAKLAKGVAPANIHEAEIEVLEWANNAPVASARAAEPGGPTSSALITGSEMDDVLDGGAENDNIKGFEGNDTLNGNDGHDLLNGGPGMDTLNGGNGLDRAAYKASGQAVTVDLGAGTGTGGDAEGDTYSSVEQASGGPAGDTLIGDAGGNYLNGVDGDDTLIGGDGNDTLVGGPGADVLNGGAGDADYAWYAGASAGVGVNLGGTGSSGDAAGDTYSGVENVRGSNHDDSITGDNGPNWILAANGNDTLNGGDGDDYLIGGAGSDANNGGAGNDWASWAGSSGGVTANLTNQTVSGGDAAGDTISSIENLRGSNTGGDNFTGDDNDNEMVTSGGSDTLIGNGGDDGLLGGDDVDVLRGGDGDDVLNGGDGNDDIDCGDGNDVIAYNSAPSAVTVDVGAQTVSGGGSHRDTGIISFEGAVGSDHNDTLIGDSQPNVFTGGLGNDIINGGDDRDTASYSDHEVPVTATANGTGSSSATSSVGNDNLMFIENLVGGEANDNLTGDSGRNTLSGRLGNDTLDGTAGPNSINTVSYNARVFSVTVNLPEPGSSSTATVPALGETDTLRNFDHAVGGEGNDSLIGNSNGNVLDGKEGGDTLNGGAGKDTATYAEAGSGVIADLVNGGSAGDAAGDDYISIEDLRGTEFADVLRGDDNVNLLLSAAGDDVLEARGGDDFLIGGLGADSLDGGPGTDMAAYTPSMLGVTLNLVTGGTAGDAAGDSYTSIENVRGSRYDDDITGDGGDNLIVGAGGNDTINGAGGSDALLGSSGADTFVFTDDIAGDTDTVVGFNPGEDRLNVFNFYMSFAAVQANMVPAGSSSTRIHLPAGGVIQLNNVAPTDLSAGDFVMSAPFAPPPVALVLPAGDQYRRAQHQQRYAVRPASARETLELLLG